MAQVLVNEECLTNIANAIRGKCSTTCGYKPGEMAAAIESITVGSLASGNADSLIDRSITAYASEDLTTIGAYAFYGCPLTTLDCPNVTSIGSNAFYEAGDEDATLTLSFPKVISVGDGSFKYANIHTVDIPVATTLNSYCFQNSLVVNINAPLVEAIPSFAFEYCNYLESLTLTNAKSFGTQAIKNCHKLTKLVLPNVEALGANFCAYCGAMETLILSGSVVPTIDRSSLSPTFSLSNFTADGGGKIYVPRDMIASYLADSYWSAYLAEQYPDTEQNLILAIEDYPEITGG